MILKVQPDAQVSLRKGSGGVFDITVDGRLVYSKKATGQFPSEQDVERILD